MAKSLPARRSVERREIPGIPDAVERLECEGGGSPLAECRGMCVVGPVWFLRRALPSPVIPVGRRDVCRGAVRFLRRALPPPVIPVGRRDVCRGGLVRFLRRALPSPVIPVGRRDVCRGDFCTAPGAGTRLQRLLPTASGERVLSEADPGKFYFRRAEVVCVRRRCIGYFVRR